MPFGYDHFQKRKYLCLLMTHWKLQLEKKRKKGELIVNQTCMQMFNCEYNINIHLHLLFFFMLACYILLVLKITLNEIFSVSGLWIFSIFQHQTIFRFNRYQTCIHAI